MFLIGSLVLIDSGLIAAAPRFVVDDDVFTKAATDAAERLHKEGKLVSLETLLAQPPSKVPLKYPAPVSGPVTPTELYDRLRAGTVAIGELYHCHDCGNWHINLATGFTVAEGGIVSTCSHVLDYDEDEMKDAFAIAVDSEAHVFPVKELLANDPDSDTCLVRVESGSLRPLPVRAGALPGERVFCLSHPDGHYFMFTQGIVARVSQSSMSQNEDETEPHPKARPTLSLEVTSEYSPGSSGGPIADESGNVVAQVDAIDTDGDDESGPSGVVTARTATAAEEILRLAEPGNRPAAKPAAEALTATNPTEALAVLHKAIDAYEDNENDSAEDRFLKLVIGAVKNALPLMIEPDQRREFSLLTTQVLFQDPGNKELKKVLPMLKEIGSDEKASPEEKEKASNLIVSLASDAVEDAASFKRWEKQYLEHAKAFPDDPELPDLKLSLLELAEEYAFERLGDIAQTLVTDHDNDVEDAAKTALATVKIKRELKAGPLELKFTALDGAEVDVAKLRGKVVLIDFWATWCGPCMASLPKVKKAYEALHARGFEVVGISLDEDKEALETTLKKKGMTWPQYFDGKSFDGELASRFGISAIPTMWLVDKQGMLVDFEVEGGDLAGKVRKLLGE